MNINNLTDEAILKFILINDNQFYSFDYIKNKLEHFRDLYYLNEERIYSCLMTLNTNDLFFNIDLYYEKCLDKKQINKMRVSEIIRYIVRNIYKDYSNSNFNTITNELVKLHLSKKKICECLEYLETHLEDVYKSDRYILNPVFLNNKEKHQVVYNKKIYKMKNLYIVYNENNNYFCIRYIDNKTGEINLYGDISNKKYYKNIIYDYYDIKTGELVYMSNLDTYQVESMNVFNSIFGITGKTISLKKIEKMIHMPIAMFDKPKMKQL